jgi:hypothetical protein
MGSRLIFQAAFLRYQAFCMFSEKPEVKISRQVLAPENQRSEKTIRFHLRETGAKNSGHF